MSQRGTSNAPLILGIIGAIVSLPNLLCAAACGTIVAASGSDGGGVIAVFGAIPVVLGFISAFYGKSKPTFCGIGMIISAVISFIFLILTGFTSILTWAALILFTIAGIIAFVQEKENV